VTLCYPAEVRADTTLVLFKVERKYNVMMDSSGVYIRKKFQYNPSNGLNAITRGKTQMYRQNDNRSLLLIGNKANRSLK
jgi:hypothetical protein